MILQAKANSIGDASLESSRRMRDMLMEVSSMMMMMKLLLLLLMMMRRRRRMLMEVDWIQFLFQVLS